MSKPIVVNFPSGATPIGTITIPISTDLNIDVLALINNGRPLQFPYLQRKLGFFSGGADDLFTIAINFEGYDVNNNPLSENPPGPIVGEPIEYTTNEYHIITSLTITGTADTGGTLEFYLGDVGQSQWFLFDLNRPYFGATIQTSQTGTLTYTVEYTSDELTVKNAEGIEVANPNLNRTKTIQLTDSSTVYVMENSAESKCWNVGASPMRAHRFIVTGGADAGSLQYIVTQTGI
jgi:hypothetical protein